MSLNFPTLEEILRNDKWRTALTSDTFGIANPDSTKICGRVEMLKFMPGLRAWSAPSPTARRILEYVERSYVTIHVIGMKGCGYSCFDSDCPQKGHGTAYVDIVSQYKVSGANLHTNVVVLHELGHAKQFIENPFWFGQVAANLPNVNLQSIQTAAKNMEAGRYSPHRFKRGDDGAWKGVMKSPPKTLRGQEGLGRHGWKPVPVPPPLPNFGRPAIAQGTPAPPSLGGPPGPPPPPVPGGAGGPPPPPDLGAPGQGYQARLQDAQAKLGLEGFVNPHKKWAVIVEQDNMARHEWPICRETGQPVRPGYSYISMG